jgi:hypothetical protein
MGIEDKIRRRHRFVQIAEMPASESAKADFGPLLPRFPIARPLPAGDPPGRGDPYHPARRCNLALTARLQSAFQEFRGDAIQGVREGGLRAVVAAISIARFRSRNPVQSLPSQAGILRHPVQLPWRHRARIVAPPRTRT